MAWIESHTILKRHRKVASLAHALRLRRSYAIGHLHLLWHEALDQQDDGDLSSWSDEFIAESSDYPGDAPQFVRLLQEVGWLDGKLLHDWLDYAGAFLRKRYASGNRERLVAIWAKHGRVYGETPNQPVSNPQPIRGKPPPVPNQTIPNQKKPPCPPSVEVPADLKTGEFLSAWVDWTQFRREIRHGMSPTQQRHLLAELQAMGAGRAVTAIRYTIAKGWTGLREPDGTLHAARPNGAKTRQQQHSEKIQQALLEMPE